jgi:RHS repeat-associated protein
VSADVSTTSTLTDIYSFDNKLIRRTKTDGTTIDLRYSPAGHRLTKLISKSGLTQAVKSYLTDTNNPTGYSQVIEEKDPLSASGQELTKINLYGHDLIATEKRDTGGPPVSSLHYYVYDGLGSVRSISDSNGNLLETYEYDTYGTLIGLAKHNSTSGLLESCPIAYSESPITQSDYLFTGEQWDADLGMFFLRARYLNTNTGRFHSQDTYEGRNGEPLTLHKYLYAHNNPVMFTDPSGQFILEIMLAIGMDMTIRNIDFQRVRLYQKRIFQTLCKVAARFAGPYSKVRKRFKFKGVFEYHHVLQDSVGAELYYYYSQATAFALPLLGGSGWEGSPHDRANRFQSKHKGKNPWRVAQGALVAAGCTFKDARNIVQMARDWNDLMELASPPF